MKHKSKTKHDEHWCYMMQHISGGIMIAGGIASLCIMGRLSIFSVVPILLGSYCMFTRRVFVE